MIKKEQVITIAKKLLKNSKIDYSSLDDIDKIYFTSKKDMKIPFSYGKYKGQKVDHYTISYGEMWGLEEKSIYISIDSENGEPIQIITPHGHLDIES